MGFELHAWDLQKPTPPGWTLESGFEFVRLLHYAVARVMPGDTERYFHVGLTGSVLTQGKSIKDLDVIIYPHTKKVDYSIEKALVALKEVLASMYSEPLHGYMCRDSSPDQPYRDLKDVGVFYLPDGRRVDFFFLS